MYMYLIRSFPHNVFPRSGLPKMASPVARSPTRSPLVATPPTEVDEITDLLALFDRPSAHGPASARGSPSARSLLSALSPKSASPTSAADRVGIPAGLYERSVGEYTSVLLVERNLDFAIEWKDAFDGSWLRGKGRIQSVNQTSEDYDDDSGTVMSWDILLRGEFVIETPAAATAGPAPSHSNGVDNDATHDSQALERLLASVAALAKSANGGITHRHGDPHRHEGGDSSRSGGGDAVPMARHELDQQDYMWTFQLHLGPNGMDEARAHLWLADNVTRALEQNGHAAARMRSMSFPRTNGMESPPRQDPEQSRPPPVQVGAGPQP